MKPYMDGGPSWTSEDDKRWDEMTRHNQERLDSEEIDSRYPYSSQLETVKSCLKEAFGEYAGQIRVVNSFLLDLDFFMGELKSFQDYKGDKNSEKYQELFDNVLSGGNCIIGSIIHYGIDAIKKAKKDLKDLGKSDEEVTKEVKSKFDKFLSLLKERIVYEDNR